MLIGWLESRSGCFNFLLFSWTDGKLNYEVEYLYGYTVIIEWEKCQLEPNIKYLWN